MHPAFLWVVVGLGVTIVLGSSLWLGKLNRRRVQEERERAEQALADEIADGLRLADGRLACIVCREVEATHFMPIIGVSLIEYLNPLRDLYSTTPLYRRRSYTSEQKLVCATHRDLVSSIIDESLAEIRRQTAAFTAEQERRVSALRSGEIVAIARGEHLKSTRRLRRAMEAASMPLLEAAKIEEVAVSGGKKTNGHVEAN